MSFDMRRMVIKVLLESQFNLLPFNMNVSFKNFEE